VTTVTFRLFAVPTEQRRLRHNRSSTPAVAKGDRPCLSLLMALSIGRVRGGRRILAGGPRRRGLQPAAQLVPHPQEYAAGFAARATESMPPSPRAARASAELGRYARNLVSDAVRRGILLPAPA
jgi:hypothetical protein